MHGHGHGIFSVLPWWVGLIIAAVCFGMAWYKNGR